MKIRRFKVITWKHIVIYGFVLGFGWLCAWLAHRAPADQPIFSEVPEWVVRWTPSIGLFIWNAICILLVLARYRYQEGIAWYTRQGVAVHPGKAADWLSIRRGELEEHISNKVAFWCDTYPDKEDLIRNRVNGHHLEVIVQDEPVRDPWTCQEGRGITEGGKTRILWEPGTQGRDFFAILRHELGHLCLKAAGVGGTTQRHHGVMEQVGDPDA